MVSLVVVTVMLKGGSWPGWGSRSRTVRRLPPALPPAAQWPCRTLLKHSRCQWVPYLQLVNLQRVTDEEAGPLGAGCRLLTRAAPCSVVSLRYASPFRARKQGEAPGSRTTETFHPW